MAQAVHLLEVGIALRPLDGQIHVAGRWLLMPRVHQDALDRGLHHQRIGQVGGAWIQSLEIQDYIQRV